MLFEQRFWAGLADGSVTVAFRKWKRPTVKAGGNLRSPGGYLAIDDVAVIDVASITARDVRRAGYADRAELMRELDKRDGTLYRVRFHLAGPDPRDALREQTALTDAEWADLVRRLERLDRASKLGPWTTDVLRLIERRPAVRAPDLAASMGRETQPFKLDVRKLKVLGLTESLKVGYRLSPRGEALLRRLDRAG